MANVRILTLLKQLVPATVAVMSCTSVAMAQTFPTRPVHIIVNMAPGGLTDIMTRLVAQKMGEYLRQSIVVENRAGGDGLIGIRAVKSAAPDGYTLLGATGTVAIQPAVKKNPGYDLTKDFAGVGPIVRSPLVIVTGHGQSDKTLLEFIARAKASPDSMTYASAGVGTTTHLGAAMFLRQAGVNILHVPYKGNGAAMPDVIAGRVSMIFEAYGSSASKVKDGLLKALAVTSTERLAELPDVPTVAEQGVPDFSYYLYIGLLAPAGTPPDVLLRLSEALQAAQQSEIVVERFRADGAEAVTMSPSEFDAFLGQDITRMSKLVSDLGLQRQ